MKEIDLDKLTDAQLREICDASQEIIEPVERIVLTGTKGEYPCPNCSFQASWQRQDRVWSIECDCGWGAAGSLGSRVPTN